MSGCEYNTTDLEELEKILKKKVLIDTEWKTLIVGDVKVTYNKTE